jgi:uncharacterized protein YbbC (DUF1343 family)/CubicO group peptidase (beta-lactamase class C family)
MSRRLFAALVLAALAAAPLCAQETFSGSKALDAALEEGIAKNQIPGAVLLVGQPGKILHRKAYGERALVPAREPMTIDTIFDAASLTKVVATTTSLMKLVEEGKVRVSDPVVRYLPDFQGGKSLITIRDLMTHFSGLRPDLDLIPVWNGYETGIHKAYAEKSTSAPGEKFQYSDINFVLLGEIVRVVSGKPLDVFATENIFVPLGMKETRFRPPETWKPRIAPTEMEAGIPLRGVVHDPTARFMGGVAGHAGLFTTADDLSRWAEMLIGMGERDGVHIVNALTVKKFTSPNSPPKNPILRGLGFDIDSPYSSTRGELFPIGSYGHTGFTGTSVWIDPVSKTYVILLANSVHPNRRPSIGPLRSKVATIAAAAVGIDAPGVCLTSYLDNTPQRALARQAQVQTGLDVLLERNFATLKGQRVGLITNHTGLTRDGQRNIDVMLAAGVNVVSLFSPEHGLAGKEDSENIANSKDEKTGIPILSLYQGKERKPGAAALRDIDVLVFDIQDVGARFYTYISTMKNALEGAAAANKKFVVLDRPNPINGVSVEGPLLDADLISFIGCSVLPLRHGMTVGELARLINAQDRLGATLEVVAMKNWRRSDWWDMTGLKWIDPSPNMRSLTAATLYPGVAMLEASPNYSVGRGTDAPFEQIGADWMDGRELAAYLNRRFIPGVRFYATTLKPLQSNFAGKTISGVRILLTDREALSTLRLGLEIAAAIERLYPGKIDLEANRKLIGNRGAIEALRTGVDPHTEEEKLTEELAPFLETRKGYLLYD